MGIETFLSVDRLPANTPTDQPLLPDSVQVTTQLMEDAVPADAVNVGTGDFNQEALYANPFREGEEEAVIVDTDGDLTYLQRTELSPTGWDQKKIDSKLPKCNEVVTVVHPDSTVWAFATPVDLAVDWVALRLDLVEKKPGESAKCKWVHVPNAIQPTREGRPPGAADSLSVSYSPDSGPCILAGQTHAHAALTPLVVYAQNRVPGTSDGDFVPWAWTRGPMLNYAGRVVGGGYLAAYARQDDPYYVAYFLTPDQLGTHILRRIDWRSPEHTPRVFEVAELVSEFVGTWYVPNMPQEAPKGDVGCVFIAQNSLVAVSARPGAPFVHKEVVGLGFDTASLWQDADGKLHVFGLDKKDNTLLVLHQQEWEAPPTSQGYGCMPKWTSAATKEGGTTTVTVGLHAKVVSYHIDPYPDYRPSELIKMEGMLPSESYCVCTQDVSTSRWATDRVRLPSTGQPHRVSHYVADAALLDTSGKAMGNYPVSVSADSLVEIQVDSLSYQVGPGKSVAVKTNPLGKLSIAMAARGLTPPVVHISAEGLESGTAIDFSTPVNDYLAGNKPLPSQKGLLSAETLKHAQTTDAMGKKAPLVKDWSKAPLSEQGVVDHCHSLYGMAAGSYQLPRMRVDGSDEPQEVAGYVIQLWDPSRPSFQVFRTSEEVEEYRSYRESHPSYGGLWDDFVGWASDVWEGIKSGATKVAEVLVEAVVDIAVWIGDALVSLGEAVVRTIEDAAQAVEAVFQMIADAVVRAIDWLKSLFALDDIWDTKVALEEGMKTNLPLFQKTIKHYKDVAHGWFEAQEDAVNNYFNQLQEQFGDARIGDFPNKVPPATTAAGTGYSQEELSTPQANWLLNKAVSPTAAGAGWAGSLKQDDPVVGRLDELMTFLTGSTDVATLIGKFAELTQFVEQFFSLDTTPGADRSALSSLIEALRKLVHDALVAIDYLVQKFMQFAIDTVGDATRLLDEELDLGFVNTLYEWVWGQARPHETPKPMTVGGFAFLVQAFFLTTIHKLIRGVDNPPFKDHATFPALPLPPWHPEYQPQQGTDYDLNRKMVDIQVLGVAWALPACVLTGVTDLAMPFKDDFKFLKPFFDALNWLGVANGAVGLLVGAPPVGGNYEWKPLGVIPWAAKLLQWICDFALAAAGGFIDCIGNRRCLLKNAGLKDKVEDVDHIIHGSVAHMVSGAIALIFNVVNTATSPPPRTPQLGLAWAGAFVSPGPDVLQIIRAIVKKYWAENEDVQLKSYIATSVVDAILALAGGLFKIPACIELENLPSITHDTPTTGTIGQPYSWKVKATAGTVPVNSGKTFAYEGLPAGFTGDTNTGEIASKLILPETKTFDVKVTVADGYLPPLADSWTFKIQINSM
ncbi:Ig domain-containing protein [Streptomyces sp. NPDC051776]|uniref:Ig domain-containing protein n=1 Tax=Streptomyces sp. NPDC051776 TaxID=3155414 RepID=UPI003418E07B